MMFNYFSPSSTVPKVAIFLFLLASQISAQQTQGCDRLSCPFDKNGVQTCPIGNITASAIGVSNFTVSLSPEPFTWTTTVSFSSENQDTVATPYERGYFLGLPPSFNSKSVNNFTGCALFFDEITSKLQFPGNFSETDTGTCQDAMGSSCVADLHSQVLSVLAGFSTTAKANSPICGELESALRDKPPASCKFVKGGSWGSIHAREIQRSTLPDPVKLSSCHPTTGFNYSVRLIDTYDLNLRPDFATIESFAFGVTPILTVLAPQNLTKRVDGKIDAELNLSCLKPILQQTGPHVVASGLPAAYRGWHSSFMVFLMAGIVSLGFSF